MMQRSGLLAAAAVGTILAAAPAVAQTTVLACRFLDGKPGGILLTVDFTARTLSADYLGDDGSVAGKSHQQLPAQITDERIDAIWRQGSHYQRFMVNRYSGILTFLSYHGAGEGRSDYRCERSQRPQRKF